MAASKEQPTQGNATPDAKSLAALRDELFHTIFQQVPNDAIVVTDARRIITAWNPAAERITGWSAAEAVGKPADLIFTPEDMAYDAAGQEMRQSARFGQAPDERWHIKKDGSRFWGSGTMNSLHLADGSVSGFVKVFRDATSLHVQTENLAFFRRLTDAVFDHPAPEQIIQTVQRLLGEHLQASRVLVSTVSDDGQAVTVTQEWSMPGIKNLTGTYRLADYGERIAKDYRAGRTHLRRDTEKEYPPGPELENVRSVQAIASIDVPVLIDGKLRNVLIVHQATARNWADHEISLVQQVADRMVAELERAKALATLRERESALEDARRRHDAATIGGQVATWVWEIGADTLHADVNLFAIFNFPDDGGRGLPIKTYIHALHPDDQPAVWAAIEHAVATGEDYVAEFRVTTTSPPKWGYGRARVEMVDGKPARLCGVVIDISQRKAAEAALAATARQRDALLNLQRAVYAAVTNTKDGEDSTDAVLNAAAKQVLEVIPAATGAVLTTLETNDQGREQLVCHAAAGAQAAHVGFILPRIGSLSGMSLDSGRPLICDDTETDPRVDLASDRKLGIRSMAVVPILRSNVNVGVLKVASNQPHAFTESDTVALQLAMSAISGGLSRAAETRAIDALRRSEARFRELADAMPQIVFTAQPDGTVDYYNRRWYEFTGFDPGLTGRESWEGIHHPQDVGRVADDYFRAIRAGVAYEGEQRYRRSSDGEYRWHLVRAVPVTDEYGQTIKWFGASTDIHDHKLLQAERESLLAAEQAARMESDRASRMKDEFLATLSHELRTPLNAIFGWVQILRSTPGNVETVKEGLTVIDRNVRAQTQIIEDILDMSRIISGKLRLDVQAIDLASLVKAGVDTVQPAAVAKNVRLTAMLDPLASRMSGDPNRLHQVFWNLINNAVKFTPKEGSVKVVLERVNSHVEVSVIDTGEGIAPEFLPFVFDRFRQADATTTRQHGGLGLGLSIVKQLVEMHGGSVRVNSAGLGKGATFTVALPVAIVHQNHEDAPRAHPASQPQVIEAPAACQQLRQLEVLIVDDEIDSQHILRRLLEDCGAKVRSAGSASDAMKMFTQRQPAVFISDIGMPGEDGYSLIRRIRKLNSDVGGNVPAIALTAYARAADRIKAFEAGFQAHLAKPVEPAELIITVASVAKMAIRK